jgi:hypothetical protein
MRYREDEHWAEAERLSLLPRKDQLDILALHRSVADDSKVPKRERAFARERLEALERHLRNLNRKKKES